MAEIRIQWMSIALYLNNNNSFTVINKKNQSTTYKELHMT